MIDEDSNMLQSMRTPDPARSNDGRLIDLYGRVARDLRVSLTDRCNLRCTYCMPEEGLQWMDNSKLLTDSEITRLVRIAVTKLGIEEVRFTGGEPLARRGIIPIITACSQLGPRPEIALTTNGIGLAKMSKALAAAGLDRLNVSFDTLQPQRFLHLTRRDALSDVLAGLETAANAGFAPIKLNSVLMRGINEDEPADLLRFALNWGFELRFIEQMPLDAQHRWDRTQMVGADEIFQALCKEFTLTEAPVARGAAPAELWLVNGGPARVGIIRSVSQPFCGNCDRTRLTADGQVRSCLFAHIETDLRSLLRGNCDDDAIAGQWRHAMWSKPAGHGIDRRDFRQPDRPMSAIGG